MKKAILFVSLAICAAAAAAQAPRSGEVVRLGPSQDPNEVVCINEREIGSRLATRRVCRTRAQWEETHQQTRAVMERVQLQKQTGNQ